MKTNKTSKILNYLVTTGIILTLLFLIALPLVLTAFLKSQFMIINSNLVMGITIAIYICAIPYVVALTYLKKLCKSMTEKNLFSEEIPNIIRKVAYCSFSEVLLFNICTLVLYLVYGIYLYAFTIVSCIIVSFVSLAIGFFAIVSAKLFEIILDIKDENDKTI